MSSKSVTVLFEKNDKLKNVLKKRYGSKKSEESNNVLKKPLRSFSKKYKTLETVVKKRYGPSRKKVKN